MSGVGLPSASSCKDPNTFLRAWPDRVFFLILKSKAFFLKELLYNLLL